MAGVEGFIVELEDLLVGSRRRTVDLGLDARERRNHQSQPSRMPRARKPPADLLLEQQARLPADPSSVRGGDIRPGQSNETDLGKCRIAV